MRIFPLFVDLRANHRQLLQIGFRIMFATCSSESYRHFEAILQMNRI